MVLQDSGDLSHSQPHPHFNSNASIILPFAALLATAPPFSRARAPMIANIACVYTISEPDAVRL
jgi:hypothetical protein